MVSCSSFKIFFPPSLFQMRADPQREAAQCLQSGSTRTSPSRPAGLSREALDESVASSSEPAQPSHYLYVPNNAGIYTFSSKEEKQV